jgi:response regulator RpfG family c-di-GMP phosphodiesterase
MLSILVVDDAREDLMLAERVLRAAGIRNPIHLLSNGDDCVRFLREKVSASSPVLVLLDLAMAPTSGIDVLRSIHESPFSKHALMIMLSGINDKKMLREGYQLGARTFLFKPLNLSDVSHFFSTFHDSLRLIKDGKGFVLEWIPSR